MARVQYDPNHPASIVSTTEIAGHITEELRHKIFGNRRLTEAQNNDILVIFNALSDTAEEELEAFKNQHLSMRNAEILVKGGILASWSRLGDVQRDMGVRLQSDVKDVMARILKKDAARGARRALARTGSADAEFRSLMARVAEYKEKTDKLIRDSQGPDGFARSDRIRSLLDTAREKAEHMKKLAASVQKIDDLRPGNREWVIFKARLLNVADDMRKSLAEGNRAIARADILLFDSTYYAENTRPPVRDEQIASRAAAEERRSPPKPAAVAGQPERRTHPLSVEQTRDMPQPPRPSATRDERVEHMPAAVAVAPKQGTRPPPMERSALELYSPLPGDPKELPLCDPDDPIGGIADTCYSPPLITAFPDSMRDAEQIASAETQRDQKAKLDRGPTDETRRHLAEQMARQVEKMVGRPSGIVVGGTAPPEIASATTGTTGDRLSLKAADEASHGRVARIDSVEVGGPAPAMHGAVEREERSVEPLVADLRRNEVSRQMRAIEDAGFETLDGLRDIPPDCVIVVCGDPKTDAAARQLMADTAARSGDAQLFRVDPNAGLSSALRGQGMKGFKVASSDDGRTIEFRREERVLKYKVPMAIKVSSTAISMQGDQITGAA